MEPLPLDEQINRVLDLILTIPGFTLGARGSIHIAEHGPERLTLKAMHGFSVGQAASCETLPIAGELTGVPASACTIIDTDCAKGHRDIRYVEKGRYGQYCVPIVSGARVLGLINVAVAEGHDRVQEEEEFLEAIANSLAGLIERQLTEMEKSSLRDRLAETEKLAALGRMTANVSHTIKNPLTAIGGFANRLLEELPEGTKERKYARLIFESSLRLENVLQNVLLFSRRDAAQREPCDLADILSKALSMYEDVCAERSITIGEHQEDLPVIEANRGQVLQAVENLIANAIDAMPQGGTLTLSTMRRQSDSGSYAVVEVKDSGTGIGPDIIDKIFEPFFTTKVLLKGTGLGLFITKKIVEDHGGFMRVESEKGTGAAFSLFFPLRGVKIPPLLP